MLTISTVIQTLIHHVKREMHVEKWCGSILFVVCLLCFPLYLIYFYGVHACWLCASQKKWWLFFLSSSLLTRFTHIMCEKVENLEFEPQLIRKLSLIVVSTNWATLSEKKRWLLLIAFWYNEIAMNWIYPLLHTQNTYMYSTTVPYQFY